MIPRSLTLILILLSTLGFLVFAVLTWLLLPRLPLDIPSDGVGGRQSATPAPVRLLSAGTTATGGRPTNGLAAVPSPTVRPWPTMQHTPTPLPSTEIAALAAQPVSTIEPPQQVSVNGLAWEKIVVMPPETIARAREIFVVGQSLGRNPRAYSKVGDSTTENPHFLARFDEGPYNLGPYTHLEPAIDYFRGSHGRHSIAVRIGLHAWTANDPAWAEVGICLPNETPVQCEIRVHNPAILLIRLGTNDVGVGEMFDANIRQIVDTAIASGVIPIIGTKGDRHEGSNQNNEILRRIAADYSLPLWDYDLVANTLPARGLEPDAAHMLTFYAHDYTDPTAYTRGHAMHNLTALMILDAVWREVIQR